MDETTKRLESAYRPRKFYEVLGQEPIVDELKALIRRGKIARHLLLAGDRGSGKTSLIRIFAKALSCESNEPDGSPCGSCKMCVAERIDRGFFKCDDGGLFEYDTAASGGEMERIARFLSAVRSTDIASKTRVVFFDEAHALQNTDFLLKEIEEGTDGLIYCFATTAPRKLGAPLLSRLWQYTVRALPDDLAVGLLRKVAGQEGISIDLPAIKLLAAVKRNYPRDLLIGLGQMASTDEHITAEAVKSAFGINQVDSLVAYFTALAVGDKARQAQVFAEWNETTAVKAEWISTFLVSLYYNHVLGLNRVIDPLIHASIERQGAIVEQWAKRLGLPNESVLRDYWERLLAFWSLHRPRDESTASLAIALFEWMADACDVGDLSEKGGWIGTGRNRERTPGSAAVVNHPGAPERKTSGEPVSEFVTERDVQLIINRASYFAQHHGAYFDVLLEVTPNSESENDAVKEINAIFAGFSRTFGEYTSGKKAPFAGIGFIERSTEKGVFGLMTAYLGLDDHGSGSAMLRSYFSEDGYFTSNRPRSVVSFEILSFKSQALQFHWNSVLDLCAGYAEANTNGDKRHSLCLLDRLGLPRSRRRDPRPIRHERASLFGVVGDRSIESAQNYKMTFLSAFDDCAFEWVRKGWELKEAPARQHELEERMRLINKAKEQFGSDPEFLRGELEELYASWPEDPRRRRRKWTGWWE